MLKKYLPYGLVWQNKYKSSSELYKLINALDNYFLQLKNYILNKYKIFDVSNLNNWLLFVKIPDNVFKIGFNVNLYDRMLIKLNRKNNTINGIIEAMFKLGIKLEIIENTTNNLVVKVIVNELSIQNANYFKSDFKSNLTGGGTTYRLFCKRLVEEYLNEVVISTSRVKVVIDEVRKK